MASPKILYACYLSIYVEGRGETRQCKDLYVPLLYVEVQIKCCNNMSDTNGQNITVSE